LFRYVAKIIILGWIAIITRETGGILLANVTAAWQGYLHTPFTFAVLANRLAAAINSSHTYVLKLGLPLAAFSSHSSLTFFTGRVEFNMMSESRNRGGSLLFNRHLKWRDFREPEGASLGQTIIFGPAMQQRFALTVT
jgi:hypothetical protein